MLLTYPAAALGLWMAGGGLCTVLAALALWRRRSTSWGLPNASALPPRRISTLSTMLSSD
jgi:hypothetical protein